MDKLREEEARDSPDRYCANRASCASEMTKEKDEEKRSRTKRRQNVRPNED